MNPPLFVAPGGDAPASSDPARRLSQEERDAANLPYFLEYAKKVEREHPEYLEALGQTSEELARGMTEPGKTIPESVEAGWISAAEGRYLLEQATLDDLLELGHSPDAARAILEEQAREAACASSS